MIQLPTQDDNSFVIQASLDDLAWQFRLDWNAEQQWWSLAVADASEAYQLEGVILVPNFPVLFRWHHRSVPTGELIAAAQEAQKPVGRDSFISGAAQLVYLTAAEYAAL